LPPDQFLFHHLFPQLNPIKLFDYQILLQQIHLNQYDAIQHL
jgi:hypothetical protein